jgi:hypothetical protein
VYSRLRTATRTFGDPYRQVGAINDWLTTGHRAIGADDVPRVRGSLGPDTLFPLFIDFIPLINQIANDGLYIVY